MVILTVWFICWLWGVMFVNLFVSVLVGGYVWYLVGLFVGWWLYFNSRDGVSVGVFITDKKQTNGC